MKTSLVSTVIATYRRPQMLRDTVRSLSAVTVPAGIAVEVLVVDNDPDGSARAAAEESEARLESPFTLRYVHETRVGLSHARNRGIEEARGDIIAFLDDDVFLCRGWLTSILDCFARTGAEVVGGRIVPYWEGEPDAAVRATEGRTGRALGECDQEMRGRHLPGGGNSAFRREVFAGGLRFSTELGRVGGVLLAGEDSELFQRLRLAGKTLWFCSGAAIDHRIAGDRLTPAYVVRKHHWFGISYAIIDRRLRGRFYQVSRACARVAKAALLDAPSWLLGLVRRDPSRRLLARCSLAKQVGYVRGTLAWGEFAASRACARPGSCHPGVHTPGSPR